MLRAVLAHTTVFNLVGLAMLIMLFFPRMLGHVQECLVYCCCAHEPRFQHACRGYADDQAEMQTSSAWRSAA